MSWNKTPIRKTARAVWILLMGGRMGGKSAAVAKYSLLTGGVCVEWHLFQQD
jgi:hypothetical protein